MQVLRSAANPALVGSRHLHVRSSFRSPGFHVARPVLRTRAQQTETEADVEIDNCSNATGEYCTIDGQGRRVSGRTVGEMEQEFLRALSSWYFDGKSIMSDDEFQLLKEELLWNGSKVPILDKKEMQFLEASIAYGKGTPIMADDDFDALKTELRLNNSIVAAQGPRCSIRSRKMYSDATPDYLKMTLLNLPASLLLLSLLFVADYLTGFQISSVVELPPPYGVAVLWGLVLPSTFVLSTSLTNVILKDNLILKGPCPNCGTDVYTYFGEIFTVSGNRGQNLVDCPSCKASLTFDAGKRVIVVAETPEDKAEKAAAAAAAKKQKAAAARKAA
jgi:hypothetical protein